MLASIVAATQQLLKKRYPASVPIAKRFAKDDERDEFVERH